MRRGRDREKNGKINHGEDNDPPLSLPVDGLNADACNADTHANSLEEAKKSKGLWKA